VHAWEPETGYPESAAAAASLAIVRIFNSFPAPLPFPDRQFTTTCPWVALPNPIDFRLVIEA